MTQTELDEFVFYTSRDMASVIGAIGLAEALKQLALHMKLLDKLPDSDVLLLDSVLDLVSVAETNAQLNQLNQKEDNA